MLNWHCLARVTKICVFMSAAEKLSQNFFFWSSVFWWEVFFVCVYFGFFVCCFVFCFCCCLRVRGVLGEGGVPHVTLKSYLSFLLVSVSFSFFSVYACLLLLKHHECFSDCSISVHILQIDTSFIHSLAVFRCISTNSSCWSSVVTVIFVLSRWPSVWRGTRLRVRVTR